VSDLVNAQPPSTGAAPGMILVPPPIAAARTDPTAQPRRVLPSSDAFLSSHASPRCPPHTAHSAPHQNPIAPRNPRAPPHPHASRPSSDPSPPATPSQRGLPESRVRRRRITPMLPCARAVLRRRGLAPLLRGSAEGGCVRREALANARCAATLAVPRGRWADPPARAQPHRLGGGWPAAAQTRSFLGCGDGEEGSVLSKVYEERRVMGYSQTYRPALFSRLGNHNL
jgi:coenzyme Q-binding protein COQ10